jgi:5-methylcytosine-specific restriction endonuclease McrA
MSASNSAPRHRVTGLVAALAVCIAAICSLGAAGASAHPVSSGASKMCVRASIAPAVSKAGKAQGTTAKLSKSGFKCAGNWAYANADVGPTAHSVAVTFIFKNTGKAWTLKNRMTVCKAPGNQVPAILFKGACASN